MFWENWCSLHWKLKAELFKGDVLKKFFYSENMLEFKFPECLYG